MMAAVQAQVPLIVIFIGYSCFSPYLTFLFAGGSVHGATVIVSWTLRVVKLFSVLIVLVAMTQVTIKLYDTTTYVDRLQNCRTAC